MRPPPPDPVRFGQESVWDYPRPAIAESTDAHILIRLGGVVVAETRRAIRTLETSHPPSYYLPPDDIAPGSLVPAAGASFCEWKGHARYFDVVAGGERRPRAAWSYPAPTEPFAMLRDHVAFYAAAMDAASSTVSASCRSREASTVAGLRPRWRGRSRAFREAPTGEAGRSRPRNWVYGDGCMIRRDESASAAQP